MYAFKTKFYLLLFFVCFLSKHVDILCEDFWLAEYFFRITSTVFLRDFTTQKTS